MCFNIECTKGIITGLESTVLRQPCIFVDRRNITTGHLIFKNFCDQMWVNVINSIRIMSKICEDIKI